MKSYTDLEQSKKLAEILSPESADMCWKNHRYGMIRSSMTISAKSIYEYKKLLNAFADLTSIDVFYPAWSLAVLLSILPNEISTDDKFECKYQIHIRKYDGGDNTTLYQIAYGNNRGSSGSWHDMINTGEKENLIDCCVDMIFYLKKYNWL